MFNGITLASVAEYVLLEVFNFVTKYSQNKYFVISSQSSQIKSTRHNKIIAGHSFLRNLRINKI
jgi:hypothetical protein